MLNIALFGPPGAGKGTQAKKLVKKYNLVYISTGDILREEIAERTELREEVVKTIESGGLVDDEIIVKIIEKKFSTNTDANGFLFDGFPRTFAQAYILEGILLKMNVSLSCLFSLNVSRNTLIQRLQKRATLENRTDDTDKVIEKRLGEYENKTLPVIEYYKDKNIYYPIDGLGTEKEVFDRLIGEIENKLKKEWLNVIMLGYPGSGKGTQAYKLAKKFNLEFVSAEALIKKEIENNTQLGKQISPYIEKGEVEPDEFIIKLIEQHIKKHPVAHGFIFKGFPRNIVQTYIIEGLLRKVHSSISCVLYLDIGSLEALKRLMERSTTSAKKPYDTSLETIIRRLENYEKKTIPIVESYTKQNKVYKRSGLGSKDVVFNRLSKCIENAMKKAR